MFGRRVGHNFQQADVCAKCMCVHVSESFEHWSKIELLQNNLFNHFIDVCRACSLHSGKRMQTSKQIHDIFEHVNWCLIWKIIRWTLFWFGLHSFSRIYNASIIAPILPHSPSRFPIHLPKCMSNLSFDKPQNFALNIHCRSMRFSIENAMR